MPLSTKLQNPLSGLSEGISGFNNFTMQAADFQSRQAARQQSMQRTEALTQMQVQEEARKAYEWMQEKAANYIIQDQFADLHRGYVNSLSQEDYGSALTFYQDMTDLGNNKYGLDAIQDNAYISAMYNNSLMLGRRAKINVKGIPDSAGNTYDASVTLSELQKSIGDPNYYNTHVALVNQASSGQQHNLMRLLFGTDVADSDLGVITNGNKLKITAQTFEDYQNNKASRLAFQDDIAKSSPRLIRELRSNPEDTALLEKTWYGYQAAKQMERYLPSKPDPSAINALHQEMMEKYGRPATLNEIKTAVTLNKIPFVRVPNPDAENAHQALAADTLTLWKKYGWEVVNSIYGRDSDSNPYLHLIYDTIQKYGYKDTNTIIKEDAAFIKDLENNKIQVEKEDGGVDFDALEKLSEIEEHEKAGLIKKGLSFLGNIFSKSKQINKNITNKIWNQITK